MPENFRFNINLLRRSNPDALLHICNGAMFLLHYRFLEHETIFYPRSVVDLFNRCVAMEN